MCPEYDCFPPFFCTLLGAITCVSRAFLNIIVAFFHVLRLYALTLRLVNKTPFNAEHSQLKFTLRLRLDHGCELCTNFVRIRTILVRTI